MSWTTTVAGNLLQQARTNADLSQTELADRAQISSGMLAAYERGSREPSLTELQRILKAADHELRMRVDARPASTSVTEG